MVAPAGVCALLTCCTDGSQRGAGADKQVDQEQRRGGDRTHKHTDTERHRDEYVVCSAIDEPDDSDELDEPNDSDDTDDADDTDDTAGFLAPSASCCPV